MANRSRYQKLQEQQNQLSHNNNIPSQPTNQFNDQQSHMSPQNQNYARPTTPVMGNPNNIGNMIPSNIGSVLPTIPNQNTSPIPNNSLSPQGQNLSPQGQNLSGSPIQQPRPGSPLSQPPESRSLDYRKLPNPTKGFGDKAQRRITTLFTKRYESQAGIPIPRPEEEFVVDDVWNCSPKFMRSTMYHIPTAHDVKKLVSIPLGLHISPLAEQHPDEQGIPLIDHGVDGPIRCLRCRAYINPYVSWNQSGTQYTCPFCNNNNEVPLSYSSPMIGSQRQDISQRPELFKGTVEFVTTDMYKTRPPTIPIYIFVVDSSYASISNGLLYAFCAAMQRILPSVFADSNVPIGIITYDDRVTCYEITPSLTNPRIAIMPDIHTPTPPSTTTSLLQPYSLAKSNIDKLLDLIPQIAASTTVNVGSSCLGAGLQVAMKLLQSASSIGKIFLFTTGMPEIGIGKLTKRFQNPESDKEKLIFSPQLPFYSEMGTICVKGGISVDLFVGTSIYSDLTTIGEPSRMTGGQIYYYPSFNIHNHGEQLFRELYRNLARESGYDGLLRVRTSAGINQDFESGHFVKSSETDLAVAHVSCDTSLYIEFQIDEKMKENDAVYFQCAYLYTSKSGARIIRIHNLKLYATAGIPKIFKGADLDAILNALIRKSLVIIPKDTMKAARTQLLDQVVDILASYRLHCVQKSSSMGQLILPEALRLLPIYLLGVLKSHLCGQLKQGSLYPVLHDARYYAMSMIKSMNLRDQSAFIYPLVLKVHTLVEHPLFGTIDENGNVFFPGSEVDQSILDDLLSEEENSPQFFDLLIPLSRKETDLSERLFNILGSKQLQRMLSPDIFIIRQGSNIEAHLIPYLVEDVHNPPREPRDMDYTDFLRHIHNMITTKNKA